MTKTKVFESVWDALEPDPVKAENLKLRSSLMLALTRHIKTKGLTQAQAAEEREDLRLWMLGLVLPAITAPHPLFTTGLWSFSTRFAGGPLLRVPLAKVGDHEPHFSGCGRPATSRIRSAMA